MAQRLVPTVRMERILAGDVRTGWFGGSITLDLSFPTADPEVRDLLGIVVDATPFGGRHWLIRIRDVDLEREFVREQYHCTREMAVARTLRDRAGELREFLGELQTCHAAWTAAENAAHAAERDRTAADGEDLPLEGEEPIAALPGCIVAVLRGRATTAASFRFSLVPSAEFSEDEVDYARWQVTHEATLAGFTRVGGTWEADEGAAADRLVTALSEEFVVVLRGTWTDGAPSGEDDYEGMCEGLAARDFERDAYGYDLDEGYPDHRSVEY